MFETTHKGSYILHPKWSSGFCKVQTKKQVAAAVRNGDHKSCFFFKW